MLIVVLCGASHIASTDTRSTRILDAYGRVSFFLVARLKRTEVLNYNAAILGYSMPQLSILQPSITL